MRPGARCFSFYAEYCTVVHHERLAALRDDLAHAIHAGTVPSWLRDALHESYAETVRLLACQPDCAEVQRAIERAETIVEIARDRASSSSWPMVVVKK